jgi:hypothetical protein
MCRNPRFDALASLVAAVELLLLVGCASTRPPLILVPEGSQNRAVYYQRGRPFAAIRRDSATALISCEPTELFGHRYLRVWLLYFNRSTTPILIDPLRQVTLTSTNVKTRASTRSVPDLPHRLLSEAANRRQRELIVASIVGGIRALGAQNTEAHTTGTVTSTSGSVTHVSTTTVINDAGEKAEAEARRAREEINEAYYTLERSLNAGVLRKHTVFPGDGVHGYLYIPLVLQEFRSAFDLEVNWRLEDVRHVVRVGLPMLADTVTFSPESGD